MYKHMTVVDIYLYIDTCISKTLISSLLQTCKSAKIAIGWSYFVSTALIISTRAAFSS